MGIFDYIADLFGGHYVGKEHMGPQVNTPDGLPVDPKEIARILNEIEVAKKNVAEGHPMPGDENIEVAPFSTDGPGPLRDAKEMIDKVLIVAAVIAGVFVIKQIKDIVRNQ